MTVALDGIHRGDHILGADVATAAVNIVEQASYVRESPFIFAGSGVVVGEEAESLAAW